MATNLATFRLPPSKWNTTLFKRMTAFWFGDLPSTATTPSEENVSTWFGLNRTPEQRTALDTSLSDNFGDALAEIAPDKLRLPPFISFAADRAQVPLLTAPFRRLEALRSSNISEKTEGALGLVLLLDQVPRNIFREERALCFAHYDRLSRALAYAMMTSSAADGEEVVPDTAEIAPVNALAGLHKAESLLQQPVRNMWLTLPLMHSEDLADHDLFHEVNQEYMKAVEAAGDQEAQDYIKQNLGFEAGHRKHIEMFGRYPHRNPYLGRETTEEERKMLEESEEGWSKQ